MSDRQPDHSTIQQVIFQLENEEYGIDILRVQEIIKPTVITHVPNTPAWMEGIINLRGQIVSIINLRKFFNLEQKSIDKNNRIIILEIAGQIVGFMVDEVKEVLSIPVDVIQKPTELAIHIHKNFIKGFAQLEDRLIILLDTDKLDDFNQLADSASSVPSKKAARRKKKAS